jgi:hypothetical protein
MWTNDEVNTEEEFISNKWMDNLYANSKTKGVYFHHHLDSVD